MKAVFNRVFVLMVALVVQNFAFADTITISAPAGAKVSPVSTSYSTGNIPFALFAKSSSGHHITAWVIYIDSESKYKYERPTSSSSVPLLETSLCVPAGSHKVKAAVWDSGGALASYTVSGVVVTGSCTGATPSPTPIANPSASPTPSGTPVSTGPTIPNNAIVSHNMDQMCNQATSSCPNGWKWKQDPNGGGSGSTTGSTSSLTSSMPARSGSPDSLARHFSFEFSGGWADELYSTHVPAADGSLSAAKDTTSTNFVYDAWVYTDHPEKLYALEFDMNQGISSGGADYQVIYGIQCNLDKDVWQYTDNGARVDTNVPCPRAQWTAGWHHLQLYFQRDGLNSVFHSVTVDGQTEEFLTSSGTHPVANNYHDNGWAPGIMVLNFQIDSLGSAYSSGTVNAYLDSLTVDRW